MSMAMAPPPRQSPPPLQHSFEDMSNLPSPIRPEAGPSSRAITSTPLIISTAATVTSTAIPTTSGANMERNIFGSLSDLDNDDDNDYNSDEDFDPDVDLHLGNHETSSETTPPTPHVNNSRMRTPPPPPPTSSALVRPEPLQINNLRTPPPPSFPHRTPSPQLPNNNNNNQDNLIGGVELNMRSTKGALEKAIYLQRQENLKSEEGLREYDEKI